MNELQCKGIVEGVDSVGKVVRRCLESMSEGWRGRKRMKHRR